MRSTIEINDSLLKEALRLTGARTKRELIHLSLKELIKKKRIERLMAKMGKLPFVVTLKRLQKLRAYE